ncbi:MAG TPA: hypothetical protein VF792_09265 [Ktedonobacterales bacterium]
MSRQHWSPTEREQGHRQLTAGGPTDWTEQAGIQRSTATTSSEPVRLALTAHEPEARLAHWWAMRDSLTTTRRLTKHYAMR